jgi:hypothetical protein
MRRRCLYVYMCLDMYLYGDGRGALDLAVLAPASRVPERAPNIIGKRCRFPTAPTSSHLSPWLTPFTRIECILGNSHGMMRPRAITLCGHVVLTKIGLLHTKHSAHLQLPYRAIISVPQCSQPCHPLAGLSQTR